MMRDLPAWPVLLVLAIALASCERAPAPPPRNPTTSPPAQAKPAKFTLPDGFNRDELVSKLLIEDTTVADRHLRARYKRDHKVATGGVLGLCYVPFDKAKTVPRRLYLAVEGASAVKNPEPGEAVYYRTHMPYEPVLLGQFNARRKRYPVERVAIIVRNVERGRRARLERPVLALDYKSGQLRVPKLGYNHSAGRIAFMPLSERIQFYNLEFYSADFRVTHVATGKTVFRSGLAGYGDPKFPGKRYGAEIGMARPRLLQSPPITEPGMYRITCGRRPWLRAWAIAVDSPYVAVTGENGRFRLSGLPEGEYEVDVWHPQFEPEQRRHKIRIDPHRTREALIRFKPPKWLTDPPPMPATPVKQWALLGPFEQGRTVYPPERRLDWRAVEKTTYRYKQVSPLRWRVSDGRLGHYAATGFFYTELHSPRAQTVRLGFGHTSHQRGWQGVFSVRARVNGKQIYQYHGDWHGSNAAIVPCRLKAGRNGLLIRVDSSRYNHWTMVHVTYEGDGVVAMLPGPLRPRKK